MKRNRNVNTETVRSYKREYNNLKGRIIGSIRRHNLWTLSSKKKLSISAFGATYEYNNIYILVETLGPTSIWLDPKDEFDPKYRICVPFKDMNLDCLLSIFETCTICYNYLVKQKEKSDEPTA